MDVGLDDSVNFGSNQILFIIFISCLLCASVSLWLTLISSRRKADQAFTISSRVVPIP